MDEPRTGKSTMTKVPPVAEDWGNRCSVQEKQPTSTLHQVCNWNDWKAVIHIQLQHFYEHQHFCSQKCILWTVSLLLGWTGTTWPLEFGVKQCCIWLNLQYSKHTYESGFQFIYLGLKTTDIALHNPSFQLTVGHHSAHFYWQKTQGNAKETAPQQSICNQKWYCWAEEHRACLL